MDQLADLWNSSHAAARAKKSLKNGLKISLPKIVTIPFGSTPITNSRVFFVSIDFKISVLKIVTIPSGSTPITNSRVFFVSIDKQVFPFRLFFFFGIQATTISWHPYRVFCFWSLIGSTPHTLYSKSSGWVLGKGSIISAQHNVHPLFVETIPHNISAHITTYYHIWPHIIASSHILPHASTDCHIFSQIIAYYNILWHYGIFPHIITFYYVLAFVTTYYHVLPHIIT